MLSINICGGIPPELQGGTREIAALLGLDFSEKGLKTQLQKGDKLAVCVQENECTIIYRNKVEFFRALALLVRYEGKPVAIEEISCFKRCGVMLDCSRNAVLTVDAIKNILCRMALMGLDLAMMYTEDTYTLPQQPYFGYLRGRYTPEELCELDDYADMFGIEMIPCIQTLAHLERALQWPCMKKYCDTEDILMVGAEETYHFIREMLQAASAPYRSNRIHIGMDEAYSVGRGKYLNKNGYTPVDDLMKQHLACVHSIIDELGLKAMMWSDMHFTAASPTGGVYPPDANLTPEIIASAPNDIDLVYWDYYHETETAYENILKKHTQFGAQTVFAGGIWTWLGPAADYRKTIAATWPALEQCRKNGVQEVFATTWLDDGAETNLQTILYGLQLFAEYRYTQNWNKNELAARFRTTCGADANAFLAISKFNQLPGMAILPEGTANPCRILLYEDPLMPMFEADLIDLADPVYYEQLTSEFETYRDQSSNYAVLMNSYACLARFLYLKCLWRADAATAVRTKNLALANALCSLADECKDALQTLRNAWLALWMSTNKPFGFEVLDIRLGGAIARFETAKVRMNEFATGAIKDILELSCDKLPILRDSKGRINCNNLWASYVSAGLVGRQHY